MGAVKTLFEGSGFEAITALGIGLLVFIGIIFLAIAVFTIIVEVKLFKKCGYPGWAAIVPGYNVWVLTKISGCHWIMFAAIIAVAFIGKGLVGTILGYASIFANVCVSYNLAMKFKKEPVFTVGLVLLPLIFEAILALSNKETYNKDVPVKNGAFFDINF